MVLAIGFVLLPGDDSDTLSKRRINKIFVPETVNVSFSTGLFQKRFLYSIQKRLTPPMVSNPFTKNGVA